VLCRERPLRRADRSCRGVLLDACASLILCDLEISTLRRSRPDYGSSVTGGKNGTRVRIVKDKPTVQIQDRTEHEVSRVLVKFSSYI